MSQTTPTWEALYGLAAVQEGHFTTKQAAEAGYSLPLIAKYLASGRVVRIRRNIYRLVHFPPGEHEDLSVLWLWSDRKGVFSHQTALSLHELSDVLPGRTHLTVPLSWKTRRLRIPEGLVLHYGDFAASEKTWVGSIPVTAARRALSDCVDARVSPEIVGKALSDALRRGLVVRDEMKPVSRYLARFERTK